MSEHRSFGSHQVGPEGSDERGRTSTAPSGSGIAAHDAQVSSRTDALSNPASPSDARDAKTPIPASSSFATIPPTSRLSVPQPDSPVARKTAAVTAAAVAPGSPRLSASTSSQTALGRGRAPALLPRQGSGRFESPVRSTSVSVNHGSMPPPRTALISASASRQQGTSGHRSVPSTSHSITFSEAGNNQYNNYTDYDSVFSGAEDEPRSRPALPQDGSYFGYKAQFYVPPGQVSSIMGSHQGAQHLAPQQVFAQLPQSARRAHAAASLTAPTGGVASANTTLLSAAGFGASGKMSQKSSLAGLRPDMAIVKGKDRSRSRSKARIESSESENEEHRGRHMSRGRSYDDSANPLPVNAKLSVAAVDDAGLDDDEVEHRDRGEELVRRRMRERKKEKRAAEKREQRRKEEEFRRDRQREMQGLTKGQNIIGTSGALTSVRDSMASNDVVSSYEERPNFPHGGSEAALSLSRQNSRGMLPAREISSSTATPGSPYSMRAPLTAHTSEWPPPTTTSSALLSVTPTPNSPFFPANIHQHLESAIADRSVSYAASSASRRAGGEGDEQSDAELEEAEDRVPELQSKADQAWRDEVARSMKSHENSLHPSGQASVHSDTGTPVSTSDVEEEEDEADSNADGVEYTLKDRQDAINIEHPFGLPIWKPALYRKSRSTNRNADKELHEAPSYAVSHHLLLGNILWALLFGWWLGFGLNIIGCLMYLIPFGGPKYGTVFWELGIYLFWPFGRYVERYDVQAALDAYVRGYDECSEDDSSTVYGEVDRGSHVRDASYATATPLAKDHGQTSAEASPRRQFVVSDEQSALTTVHARDYGTQTKTLAPILNSSGSETEVADFSPFGGSSKLSDEFDRKRFRIRALGRVTYWLVFYLLVAPILLIVCTMLWACVFTIPMAKLLWILLINLNSEPLALAFRSPSPNYVGNNALSEDANGSAPLIEAGQRAPRHSRKTYERARAMGKILGPKGEIILCTYKAFGLKYYKYTIDGTNIIFINLLPLILFVIFDFFVIAPIVERKQIDGFLGFIAGQGTMFILALLSVIPLSYFIGMAVASISAQSSIGMGAVINATFGSIIEIILYGIALTQGKGQLVEGSIVGSLLAGVLLMPGVSMIGGAFRRKEQRFNARSAGVTSTMLIMAIIGILTPTLFYEIYGTFKLTCTQCPGITGDQPDWSCQRCFYEHVDPVDDDFYRTNVQGLSYYCASILIFSYLIGLWFSLRTHASHIWQNQQVPPVPIAPHTAMPQTAVPTLSHLREDLGNRRTSLFRKVPESLSKLIPGHAKTSMETSTVADTHGLGQRDSGVNTSTPSATPGPPHAAKKTANGDEHPPGVPVMQLTSGYTIEDVNRAYEVISATASALREQRPVTRENTTPTVRRQASHAPMHDREISRAGHQAQEMQTEHAEGSGGHDAPNWSRTKSYSVLMGCTFLYAVIAEILVDVVDVVLDGSGIPEKFLGITLFALVPNTTEFMNAISFAMNGNIALSMEIGSAYAIQVCLLQIPAMIAFTYFYSIGKDTMIHRAFTLVFPRWDAICIIFSVFLLTYVYLEARSNYYRGSILVLSYMVLLGGFYAAPPGLDNSDDPLFTSSTITSAITTTSMPILMQAQALFTSLFTQ